MPVIDGVMTRYMRYWGDISVTQLFVGHIGHLKNACNGWNYDQIYEILGGHLIDPTTCGYELGNPRMSVTEGIMARYMRY